MSTVKRLGDLHKGQLGTITTIHEGPTGLAQRLMEMGFVEGNEVLVLLEAPFGKDPIAVRVRGAILALRRQEANLVEVTLK